MCKSQRIILCIWILGLSFAPSIKAEKLKVTILYESLCPDSIRFVVNQLAPSYSRLQDYISVQFVPFGKAFSENGGDQFVCQHGQKECRGNRIQSCVLQQTSDQAKQVEFVACQMAAGDRLNVDECAKSVGLNPDIWECVKSSAGKELQLEAEKITRKYNPQFVPTIVYDDVFNQNLQDRSIRNFRSTVCSVLKGKGINGLSSPRGPCA